MIAEFQFLVNQSPVIGHLDYFQFSYYKQPFSEHFWASIFFCETFKNIYLLLCVCEREREGEHEWGRSREGGRHNLKQAPGSELLAQSPMRGSNAWTYWATQAPLGINIFMHLWYASEEQISQTIESKDIGSFKALGT